MWDWLNVLAKQVRFCDILSDDVNCLPPFSRLALECRCEYASYQTYTLYRAEWHHWPLIRWQMPEVLVERTAVLGIVDRISEFTGDFEPGFPISFFRSLPSLPYSNDCLYEGSGPNPHFIDICALINPSWNSYVSCTTTLNCSNCTCTAIPLITLPNRAERLPNAEPIELFLALATH